jgi:hypothetical protein
MNAHERTAGARRLLRVLASAAPAAIAAAVACGGGSFQSSGPPSDVSGDYAATLTNGSNGCQFSNWTAGSTAENVHLTVQQTGSEATATVTGVAGLLFDVILGGTPQFQGTVTGDSFTLTAVGTNSAKDGQCSFTIKATLTGTLSGDAIQGQLSYAETTNDSSDCGFHATCSSVQSYAGVRAPDAGAAGATDASGD